MKLRLAILSAVVALAVAACSGGGSSSPAPGPTPTVPGVGYTGAFSATVTFSVIVPSTTAAASIRRRNTIARTAALRDLPVRAVASASPSAPPSGPPYVSPLVGFIQITPIAVNGSSLAVTQPPTVITGGCPVAGAGCTLKGTVPAAPGAVNRYFVQTYASNASGGFGTLISSGYVDVTVPATGGATASLGGATISLGGYVASIKFSPASADLPEGAAANLNVIVEALDASGAVIIGDTYFAIPIGVTSTETRNFTIDGQTGALTIAGTSQQQIALAYSGGVTLGTVLAATSTDSNGNSVAAKLPVAVTTPTPSPTPIATATPPGSTPTPISRPSYPALSVYVVDGVNDNILEYDVVSKVLDGTVPSPAPTPRRVVQFNSAALPGSVSCNQGGFPAYGLGLIQGLIVDAGGRILTQSSCTDFTSTYVYAFAPTATGVTTPTVFGAEPNGYVSNGMGAAAGGSTYYFTLNNNAFAPFGFTSSGTLVSEYFTNQCAAELGQSPACTYFGGPGSYFQESAIGADASNNLYVAQAYYDNILSSANPPVPITPPGPGSAPLYGEPPAVSLYAAATGALPAVLPELDIAGLNSDLAGTESAPIGLAVDGNTLYVLAPAGEVLNVLGAGGIYPGLSTCAPPTAPQQLNPPDTSQIYCADSQQHEYLVAFDISNLTNVANFGLDVELAPKFIIGGDTVGRFGEGAAPGFETLAASHGIVAIINPQPSATSTLGEIDVYDTRTVSGTHIDVPPVLSIPFYPASGSFNGTYYNSIAIGPTGSATGGLTLLAKRNQHPGRITHHRSVRR
jgi:hypothetical protein